MMKSVLVIDDDDDVREVIVFALENEGFKVLPYENGRTGLDALLSLKELPGLIIVDYLMPEMDGVAFINEVRTTYNDRFADVPIAFSSAMGQLDKEIVNDANILHLHKPMDLEDLLKEAKKYCCS